MDEELRKGLDAFYAAQTSEGETKPLGLMIEVGRPKYSHAMSVHPEQVKEAEKSALEKGVPTHFRKDGCPLFTSRSHQKRYLRAYNYINRDAGYGD